tara:strand:- start:372 stop:521 length:150 start_codon:yes stop_codon:yes gene_type:complete
VDNVIATLISASSEKMEVALCAVSGLLSHRAVVLFRGIFGWWPLVLSYT